MATPDGEHLSETWAANRKQQPKGKAKDDKNFGYGTETVIRTSPANPNVGEIRQTQVTSTFQGDQLQDTQVTTASNLAPVTAIPASGYQNPTAQSQGPLQNLEELTEVRVEHPGSSSGPSPSVWIEHTHPNAAEQRNHPMMTDQPDAEIFEQPHSAAIEHVEETKVGPHGRKTVRKMVRREAFVKLDPNKDADISNITGDNPNMGLKSQHLFVSMRKLKNIVGASGIQAFQYFTTFLQETDIELSETLVIELQAFAKILIPEPDEPKIAQTTLAFKKSSEREQTSMIYFELFQIQPIRLNLTFTRGLEKMEVVSGPEILQVVVDIFTNAVGNVDSAPIRLNGLVLNRVLADQGYFSDAAMKHYIRQFIKEAFKVIGSIEVIGNPVETVTNISSGFEDLFYEPAYGATRGPREFMKGVGKGVGSLSQKVTGSAFGIPAQVLGSFGKGMNEITLDTRFQNERRKLRRQQLQKYRTLNVKRGFETGGQSLKLGIKEGFLGVGEQIKKGSKEAGGKGAAAGFFKGITGLVTKPMVGILDFASQVTGGFANQILGHDTMFVQRIRNPRCFTAHGTLTPYDEFMANAHCMLQQLVLRNPELTDSHVIDVITIAETMEIFLITEEYLLVLKLPEDQEAGPYLHWGEELRKIKTMVIDENELIFTFSDGAHMQTRIREIACSDQNLLRNIEEKVDQAYSRADIDKNIHMVNLDQDEANEQRFY